MLFNTTVSMPAVQSSPAIREAQPSEILGALASRSFQDGLRLHREAIAIKLSSPRVRGLMSSLPQDKRALPRERHRAVSRESSSTLENSPDWTIDIVHRKLSRLARKKKWKRRSKLLRRNSRDPQIISTYQESLSAVSATTASRLPFERELHSSTITNYSHHGDMGLPKASSGRTGSGHKLDGGNDRGIESANPNTNQHQPSHRSQIITLLTLLRKIRRDKMKRSGGVFPEEDAEYFAQVEQSEKRQCFQATPCPSRRPKPTKVTPQSTTRMTRHVGESADSEKLGVAIQSKRPSHGPDQGFNTLSDLIYVRSQWDAYLAPCMMPGAHAIPSHFPQPSPPSWPEWSLVLSNICTSEQDTTMK